MFKLIKIRFQYWDNSILIDMFKFEWHLGTEATVTISLEEQYM